MLDKRFLQGVLPSCKLIIIGASGSIGQSTLAYIKTQQNFELLGASIHMNSAFITNLLEYKSLRFLTISGPCSPAKKRKMQHLLEKKKIQIFFGSTGLTEMIRLGDQTGADTVVMAIPGAIAIGYTAQCLLSGLKVALANKEVIVTAGPAFQWLLTQIHSRVNEMQNPIRRGVLLPVDSEHNGLFQLSENLQRGMIRRWVLTSSGGPLLQRSKDEVKKVKKKDVLSHPTWKMGAKITVDSAGMINKGLEVIEAMQFFQLNAEETGVFIHPQSHVHSLLYLRNGSYIMHANKPDMTYPISHVLHYPDNPNFNPEDSDIGKWPALEFQEVPKGKFPGFSLALQCAKQGGTSPAVFNAANEIAVAAFLRDELLFFQIPQVIEQVLELMPRRKHISESDMHTSTSLGDTEAESREIFQKVLSPYLEADRLARTYASECVEGVAS